MTKDPIFTSDRVFEVWHYTVSHRQLLLRSNKGAKSKTRLEVLFKDVAYMAMPPVMNGITIRQCDPTAERLPFNLNAIRISQQWYCLEGDGSVGFVAAGALTTSEDTLDFHEPSGLLDGPSP